MQRWQAVAEGGLPPDTDPAALGRLIFAVLQGVEFLSKTGMAPAELAEIGTAAAQRVLPNAFGDGCRAAPPRQAG
ncbi:hypothetical protein [Pseudonocardia sp. GCM10023141]|uniref:hypothetical protein n=1 Tax=Pseudonocardia sp. GCM10023141 TaxID=3252653 RepID=UPI003622A7E4